MERETYHTYIVLENNYGINDQGEVFQKGGDWYNIYTSKGEVKVSAETIKNLVKTGLTAQQIEQEGKKINDSFKLSGAIILQRGTPFDKDVTFVQDDGRTNYEASDEEVEELRNSIDELAGMCDAIIEKQSKVKSLSKKILKKKR